MHGCMHACMDVCMSCMSCMYVRNRCSIICYIYTKYVFNLFKFYIFYTSHFLHIYLELPGVHYFGRLEKGRNFCLSKTKLPLLDKKCFFGSLPPLHH